MNKTKEEKSFEERMVELHPKFLDAVKEVYPLAVLSSLCIAVTAFAQQTYPQVPQYSITAASLFLIAFIVSFAFKILSLSYFAFVSYASTALAVFFLLLVIFEFGKAIPVVSKTMNLIPNIFLVITMVSLIFLFNRFAMKTKSRVIRLCRFIILPLVIPFPIMEVLMSVGSYFGSDIISSQIRLFGFVTVFVAFMFLAIAIAFDHKERKKQKESEKKTAVSTTAQQPLLP